MLPRPAVSTHKVVTSVLPPAVCPRVCVSVSVSASVSHLQKTVRRTWKTWLPLSAATVASTPLWLSPVSAEPKPALQLGAVVAPSPAGVTPSKLTTAAIDAVSGVKHRPDLPTFSVADVRRHDSRESRLWVSLGVAVYDVTGA